MSVDTIALLGNPNVGKSTVFNALTGLNQHTGNWPGKTVELAEGKYEYNGQKTKVVDLPGAYSMLAHSGEEEVSRDYICFDKPDVVVVVCNATCLERNMNLLLQTLEITPNVIACVNMIDEAKQKGILIDREKLQKHLGIPVVYTSARDNVGMEDLKAEIAAFKSPASPASINYDDDIEKHVNILQDILDENEDVGINTRWLSLRMLERQQTMTDRLNVSDASIQKAEEYIKDIDSEAVCESIMSSILSNAKEICDQCVTFTRMDYNARDRKLDKIFTGKATGIPIMLALLAMCFWITIFGANYPSSLLSDLFTRMQGGLSSLFTQMNAPELVRGIVVDGVFGVLGWVVSVMLPPMAIFFPLFSLLEDSGYLPRIAFNIDKRFKKCCACGKQSLTMCLGLGCNAVGVMGARIIDSPRERLIAILTNNFMPCNGRFPTMIAIISMFIVGGITGIFQGLAASVVLIGVILLGVAFTFLCSYLLSKTVLKGMPSSFVMEMPSYRRPQVMKVLVRSTIDKTLKVLLRAIVVAAPAGALIWILGNTYVGNLSILAHITGFLDPFARWFGLDGVILTAFILGMPANEIVIPIILMAYMAKGTMVPFDNLIALKDILTNNGWTVITAVCTILFSLMHWPCSTTLLTIKKETGSWKWTAISVVIPTVCGLIVCFIANLLLRLVV